jgi:hypothetical protein
MPPAFHGHSRVFHITDEDEDDGDDNINDGVEDDDEDLASMTLVGERGNVSMSTILLIAVRLMMVVVIIGTKAEIGTDTMPKLTSVLIRAISFNTTRNQ